MPKVHKKSVLPRFRPEAYPPSLIDEIRHPDVHCIVTSGQINFQLLSVPEGKYLLRIIVSPTSNPSQKRHPLRAYLKPTDLWLVGEDGSSLGNSQRSLQTGLPSTPGCQGDQRTEQAVLARRPPIHSHQLLAASGPRHSFRPRG